MAAVAFSAPSRSPRHDAWGSAAVGETALIETRSSMILRPAAARPARTGQEAVAGSQIVRTALSDRVGGIYVRPRAPHGSCQCPVEARRSCQCGLAVLRDCGAPGPGTSHVRL